MKNIKTLFGKKLINYKAVYKSGNWYVNEQGLTIVINIQKSNYSDHCFLNLGISVDELQSIDFPKESFCHIRLRLGDFQLSDNTLELQAKLEELTLILDKIKSIEDIRILHKGNFFKNAFIHKDIKPLLVEM